MAATLRPPSPPAEPAAAKRRLTDRAVWWRSFALFTLMGAIWALSIPMLVGPDEAQHAGKAAAVVRGELTWVARYEIVGDSPEDPTRVETWVIMPRAYPELKYGCIALPPLRPADCMTPIPRDTPEEVAYINTAAAYPPAFYAATGWPSLFLAPSKALYAMRGLHVLFAAALLASALVAARRADRSGFTLIGVAAALTPMVTFLTATINPNGLEIAAAVGVWCGGLELFGRTDRPTGRAITRFVVAMSVLVLMRPLSIAMLGVIAIVAMIALVRWQRVRELLTDPRVWIGLGAFALAAGFAVFWLLYAEPQSTFWGTPSDDSIPEAFRHSLGEYPFRTRQMIGMLGWIDAPAEVPTWGIVAWLGVVGALAAGALVVGTARQRIAVLAALVFTVGVPIGSETLQANSVGYIWQGRYGLPIAVGLPIISAWVIGRSDRLAERSRLLIGSLAVTVLAIVQVLAYIVLMRRYVIGEPSPLLDFLTEGTWAPRLVPKPVLLLVTALIAGLTAAWYVLAGRDIVEGDTPDDTAAEPISG